MARLGVIMTFVVAVTIAAIVMLTKASRSDVSYRLDSLGRATAFNNSITGQTPSVRST